MKNIYQSLGIFLVAAITITSCTDEKRVHNKGFHVQWKHNTSVAAAPQAIEETESNEVAVNEIKTVEITRINQIEIPTVQEEEVTKKVITETVIEESVAVSDNVVESEAKDEVANASESDFALISEKEDLNYSRKEERQMKRALLRNFKSNDGIVSIMNGGILVIIITILIPFLGVLLYEGLSSRFWISLILTLLFFIPGLIYSLLVVTGTI